MRRSSSRQTARFECSRREQGPRPAQEQSMRARGPSRRRRMASRAGGTDRSTSRARRASRASTRPTRRQARRQRSRRLSRLAHLERDAETSSRPRRTRGKQRKNLVLNRFEPAVLRVPRGGEVILKTPSWRSSTQHHVLHYTAMIDVQTGLFTVAVFQDVAWAQKGLDALKQAGFPSESLTILAKESPE